jgi:hypothetical protein
MDTVQREINHFRSSFDLGEIIKRAVKYLVEGVAVGICCLLVASKALDASEIMIIALTAATTFALLDVTSPSIGLSTRQGAGLGIGFNLVGGLPVA